MNRHMYDNIGSGPMRQAQDVPPTDAPSTSEETVTGGGSDKTPSDTVETFYTPIIVLTAVFGAIFIFGPLLVRKGTHRGIIRCCIMLTAFCMWIFWVTVYISQINPLLGPRLHNTTLAWLKYKEEKTVED